MLDCTVLLHVGLLLHRKKLQTKINTVNTAQGIFCALPMTPFWLHLLCRMVCLFFHECIPQASPKLAAIKILLVIMWLVPMGVFLVVEDMSIQAIFCKGSVLVFSCVWIQLAILSQWCLGIPHSLGSLGWPQRRTQASGNWSCLSFLTEQMQI